MEVLWKHESNNLNYQITIPGEEFEEREISFWRREKVDDKWGKWKIVTTASFVEPPEPDKKKSKRAVICEECGGEDEDYDPTEDNYFYELLGVLIEDARVFKEYYKEYNKKARGRKDVPTTDEQPVKP